MAYLSQANTDASKVSRIGCGLRQLKRWPDSLSDAVAALPLEGAICNLGWAMESGLTRATDEEIDGFYRRYADQDGVFLHWMAFLLRRGGSWEGKIGRLLTMAELGNPFAQYLFAWQATSGMLRQLKAKPESHALLKQSADRGFAPAMHLMACANLGDSDSTIKAAARWQLEQAARRGYAPAMASLANYLEKGMNQQMRSRVFSLHHDAALLDYPPSIRWVANYFFSRRTGLNASLCDEWMAKYRKCYPNGYQSQLLNVVELCPPRCLDLAEPWFDLCTDSVIQRSVAGHAVNDDAILCGENKHGRYFLLADGVSGQGHGQEAAMALVQTVQAGLAQMDTVDKRGLCQLTSMADLAVQATGGQTTAVIVQETVDGRIGCSVGDSMAMTLNADSHHELTSDQKRRPLVGSGRCEPVAWRDRSKDILLLCSDGVHGHLSLRAIVDRVRAFPAHVAANYLIADLYTRYGNLPDDTSIVIVA